VSNLPVVRPLKGKGIPFPVESLIAPRLSDRGGGRRVGEGNRKGGKKRKNVVK